MKPFLETPRLSLRQLTYEDVDNLYLLDSDPEVMRFVSGGVTSSYKTIKDFFLPDALSYYEEYDNLGFWAMIEKSTREFVGWIVIRPESRFRLAKLLNVSEDNALELGYRLRKISWGKGYATEVCQALLNHVLILENPVKIIAWALPENTASIRVMKKLGMKLQAEYILTVADVLPNTKLLTSSVIQNILDRKIVKYQLVFQ